jgi:hypothetical protein
MALQSGATARAPLLATLSGARTQQGEHRDIANVLRFGTPPQRVLARRLGIDKLLRTHQRFAQHLAVPGGATRVFTSITVLHAPNDSALWH